MRKNNYRKRKFPKIENGRNFNFPNENKIAENVYSLNLKNFGILELPNIRISELIKFPKIVYCRIDYFQEFENSAF